MVCCYGSLHSHETASVTESQLLIVPSQYIGDAIIIQTLPFILRLPSYIPLPSPRIARIAIGIEGSISDPVPVKTSGHGNARV